MANILKGKAVADHIDELSISLKQGHNPCLAIFKVGNKDNDSSYERGIDKKSEKLGIKVVKYYFNQDCNPKDFYNKLDEANNNDEISGILVFRPLPKQFIDTEVRNRIDVKKDIDACSDLSLAGTFVGNKDTFSPCTAEAVIETLKFYNIDLVGKNVVVLGRSLVIGKPVSMLLLKENATVTIAHSKSRNTEDICKKADILICATGVMESINDLYVNENQTVIDVGLNFNKEKGKLCGDCDYEKIEPIVRNITPVPGGIGSITTSILLNHVVKASH